VCFIVPGLIIILALSVLFLASSPPDWVTGAAAGAGAAVPAIALGAAIGLVPASWRRANSGRPVAAAGSAAQPGGGTPGGAVTAGGGESTGGAAASGGAEPVGGPATAGNAESAGGAAATGGAPVTLADSRRSRRLSAAGARWLAYVAAGGVAANLAGPYLVAVLLGCGLTEWLVVRPVSDRSGRGGAAVDGPRSGRGLGGVLLPVAAKVLAAGTVGSLIFEAFKVGALSFGGGFVIIPLMQHDAVHTYHWMTTPQFLSAVALGQVTPGPVVQTVAVVGYAAAGLAGGLLAAAVAFAPSFVFVLAGGPHFDRFRRSTAAQSFLAGSGPAAIGAIAGAAVTLGFGLTHLWQVVVLAGAIGWLIFLRRGVVSAIVAAAGIGVIVTLAGLS
jgi:chromate transporter